MEKGGKKEKGGPLFLPCRKKRSEQRRGGKKKKEGDGKGEADLIVVSSPVTTKEGQKEQKGRCHTTRGRKEKRKRREPSHTVLFLPSWASSRKKKGKRSIRTRERRGGERKWGRG